ncbi:MAG TPA: PAS domain-containing protein, partial [Rhodoferax sp.]
MKDAAPTPPHQTAASASEPQEGAGTPAASGEDMTQEAENPWRMALESSDAGIWDCNLVTGEQTHSARWEEIIGFDAGELNQGYTQFLSRVHPDDVEVLKVAQASYLEGRAPSYMIELRMRCKDGSWKWIFATGLIVQRDAQGKPIRMIGTHTDISERKAAEQELIKLNTEIQEKSQLLQTTLTNISQGILLLDPGKHIVGFNPQVCELLDVSTEFLASRPTLWQLSELQKSKGDFGPGGCLVAENARSYT